MSRRQLNWVYLAAIVILSVFAVLAVYNPKTKQFKLKLGLDLRSGTHIALKLNPMKDPVSGEIIKVNDAVVANAISIFQKRMNPDGNKEIMIQREGEDKIIIEIPDETNVKRAESLIKKTGVLEFKELVFNPATGAQEWRTVLTGAYLENNSTTVEFSGQSPRVAFRFNKEGAKKFAQITQRNVGKPLGIFFDGEYVSSPNVNQAITGGSGEISGGSMTVEECENLKVLMNSGSLPVNVQILESMTVDPILGKQSLNYSLAAGIIGLLLVCLFMIYYYRLPGFLADLALVVYTVIILASMYVGGFVLTLPGIAGIILSIGMAVDANILIFERIKEELWGGKLLGVAIANGFHRAFSSILDGHVTTFLGAMIIYIFGSASIKGFGLTLMIGTFWSLITAVAFTRVFVDTLFLNNIGSSRKLYGE